MDVKSVVSAKFSKMEKISSPIEIEKVHSSGVQSFVHPFKVYILEKEEQSFDRLAITVPKRLFKLAVSRNLLKRRVREAYRLNKRCSGKCVPIALEMKNFDIFLVYISKKELSFKVISKAVKEILESIDGSKE